ncbi:MAG TPA: GNAT family N-acetyltransferase [Acidimicrobiales bacterium]|nr:GNAT family N-acetyltransferase [Acidimicrobiales bacterium]
MSGDQAAVVGGLHFVQCDPEDPPATELLAAMRSELIGAYDNANRLDSPPLLPAELRAPDGVYYVGYEGPEPVAGGGLRRLGDGVAEIKRMYVRPAARSRGVAAALLRALEEAARAMGYACTRLDTGPKQVTAQRLYRAAGYVEIDPYNDNPFACFWGEKRLDS